MAANAEISRQAAADITPFSQKEIEQLQQLLRRLPRNTDAHGDIEEDLDTNFAGMILCAHTGVNITEWILD